MTDTRSMRHSTVVASHPPAPPIVRAQAPPGRRDAAVPSRSTSASQAEKPITSLAVLTEGLTKEFGSTTAVDDVTLSINTGEVLGLVGPTGSGKTTTMRMLAGQLEPTNGHAVVAGHDIASAHHARQLRSTTALTPQQADTDSDTTGPEVLYYFTRLLSVLTDARGQYVKNLLKTLHLWDNSTGSVTHEYTPAMRHRVAVARTLIHSPTIVFLDEPAANVEPEEANMMRELITYLVSLKRTIVLATQDLDEAERFCDRAEYLNAGQLFRFGV